MVLINDKRDFARGSIQGCEHPPRPSDSLFLHSHTFGLPLFSRCQAAFDAVGGDSAGRARVRLSLAQNDTVPECQSVTPAPHSSPALPVATVYVGSSYASLPSIPNHGPSSPQSVSRGVRSAIVDFSDRSRTNLKHQLAQIRTDSELYTMCLSLPGYVSHFTHQNVKSAFIRFCKMTTALMARDYVFSKIGIIYKQELQRRNQLHFHLVISGVTELNLQSVWSRIADYWIRCVMDISGMPLAIQGLHSSRMRAVHMFCGTSSKNYRDSNFQKIRGNFHSYFAKYLGKDVAAHVAIHPIPGRWWGKLNAPEIPFGRKRELPLPARVAVYAHRVARRIRKVKCDSARHYNNCRTYGGMDFSGVACGVSLNQLRFFYGIFKRHGGLSSFDTHYNLYRIVLPAEVFACATAMFLNCLAAGQRVQTLISSSKIPKSVFYSSIKIVCPSAPVLVHSILIYAGGAARDHFSDNPF